jgi:hypothetical protein
LCGCCSASYYTGYNPGMKLRLEQDTLDSLKLVMDKFLPNYIEHDLNLPSSFHYELPMPLDFLSWKIDWTDIVYDTPTLDIKDVKLELTRGYDLGLIKVDFPALKKWEIDATQEVNTWILPSKSKVELIIEDLDFDFQIDLYLDENGYLNPVFYNSDIVFGKSYLYHDNKIIAFVMHQFLYFGLKVV